MTRNIRFHTMINGDFVKVTIKPGQTLRHYTAQRTEEGWNSDESIWHYDGKIINVEYVNDGSDCDGRLTRGSTGTATGTRPYQETKYNFETYTSEPIGEIYNVLDVTHTDSIQHDYNAESAGY